MQMISLADALELMAQTDRSGNAIPFSIEFVTWNRRGDRIGRKITLKHAELVSIIRGKPTKPSTGFRNINHWRNATRNIRQLGTDQITTIHIWLITKVNDLQVKWHIHG